MLRHRPVANPLLESLVDLFLQRLDLFRPRLARLARSPFASLPSALQSVSAVERQSLSTPVKTAAEGF